jgi:hypothetical protein
VRTNRLELARSFLATIMMLAAMREVRGGIISGRG